MRFDAKAVSAVMGGVVAALIFAAAPAEADPEVPVPPPAPVQAAAGDVPVPAPPPPPPPFDPLAFLKPAPAPAVDPPPAEPLPTPPDGVSHLASPDALPPNATMDPAAKPNENPNVSYLKDLWHAVQNQEISGGEALLLGLAQRGMDTPYPDQAPGPNVPLAPADPAAAPPPPAPANAPPPAPALPAAPPPAPADAPPPPPAPAPAPLLPWLP